MNPEIAAAWIGAAVGGGVALVGVAASIVSSVVSSNNTRRATERTVDAGTAANRATLVAAREDRLWEKRAAAYEESLTDLLYRQARRQHDLRRYRLDDASEQRLKAFYEDYELPGVFEPQARLVAYASDTVIEAFNAARRAHDEVRSRYSQYEMAKDQIRAAIDSGRPRAAQDAETGIEASRQLDKAREAADAADEALIAVIRGELRSKPEAVTPLPPPA
jgi:hypothetical protein